MITKPKMPRIATWVVPFAVGLCLAGDVRAQSTNRPWTNGVSQAQQMRAKVLYEAGNRFLASSLFAEAVTAYRGALQHWDHPGIHYNLALALIRLGRPIEAYEAIGAALRYGPDALHSNEYESALEHRRSLREQIAEVEVVCAEPGAAVSLDGKQLFTGPGQMTTLVLLGKHEIVASKAKHITSSKTFTLTKAVHTRIDLSLIAEQQAIRQVRKRPSRTHWTVTSVGLGAAAVAAVLHRQFDSKADRLAALLNESCPMGCREYPDMLIPLRERLERQRSIVYAGYATAGTFVAVGALLALLDHPRSAENRLLPDPVRISFAPGGAKGWLSISIHVPF